MSAIARGKKGRKVSAKSNGGREETEIGTRGSGWRNGGNRLFFLS